MSIATARIDTSRPIREIAKNTRIKKFEIPGIPRDENGKPIGMSVDEFCDKLLEAVLELYDE